MLNNKTIKWNQALKACIMSRGSTKKRKHALKYSDSIIPSPNPFAGFKK